MNKLITLAIVLTVVSSSLAKEKPYLITAPDDYTLTDKDFESLITYATFNLKKTRREAVKDMAVCVYNAGRLGWEIYQLIQAFQVQKVPSIVKRTLTCVDKCRSFKYLTLTRQCGDRVSSAARNLKNNSNIYKILKDHSRIKSGLTQLRSDLLVIEKTCVADPNQLFCEF